MLRNLNPAVIMEVAPNMSIQTSSSEIGELVAKENLSLESSGNR